MTTSYNSLTQLVQSKNKIKTYFEKVYKINNKKTSFYYIQLKLLNILNCNTFLFYYNSPHLLDLYPLILGLGSKVTLLPTCKKKIFLKLVQSLFLSQLSTPRHLCTIRNSFSYKTTYSKWSSWLPTLFNVLFAPALRLPTLFPYNILISH